ncbi:MAG: epimerase [Gammaproteobacteria bacterium SG8_30]|jgi:UDP-glucose 4-epimerase|nr:MAG: epimerase [Gammaproteobacteria bacterium SG8_30]
MRVLVTGSSGRVGRAVTVRLVLDGHDVVGLDRSPSSTADLVGDVGDKALLQRALEGVDAVVHTAALHAPHVGLVDESLFRQVNVEATVALARLMVERGVDRLVFTSTTALFGHAATPPGRAGWVDESVEPRPRTVYHRTKLAAESALETLSYREGLDVTVLRMSRCFPEPAPVMAAYRLHRGIDARDVAAAHALALESSPQGFRRYVISGATPFVRDDATELLHDAPGVLARRAPTLVEAFARRGWPLPQSIDRVYSPAVASQRLGWQPRCGFEEVLRMLDAESSEVLPPGRHDRGPEVTSGPTTKERA